MTLLVDHLDRGFEVIIRYKMFTVNHYVVLERVEWGQHPLQGYLVGLEKES